MQTTETTLPVPMSKEGRAHLALKTIPQQIHALDRAKQGVTRVEEWYSSQREAVQGLRRRGYSEARVNDELLDLEAERDKRLAVAQEQFEVEHRRVLGAALGLAEDAAAEYQRSLPSPEKVAALSADLQARMALLPRTNTGDEPELGAFARAELDRFLAAGDNAGVMAVQQVLAPALNVPFSPGESADAQERRTVFRALGTLAEQRFAPVQEATSWAQALQGVSPRVDANSVGGAYVDGEVSA